MSEIKLVRVRQFSVLELAGWLREEFRTHKDTHGKLRHLGMLARFGAGIVRAERNAEITIEADKQVDPKDELASYVALRHTRLGTTKVGMLFLDRESPPESFHTLSSSKPAAQMRVLATVEGGNVALGEIYEEGMEKVQAAGADAWTVVPNDVPAWLHGAARRAGFRPVGEPRPYDLGDGRRVSQLYGNEAMAAAA